MTQTVNKSAMLQCSYFAMKVETARLADQLMTAHCHHKKMYTLLLFVKTSSRLQHTLLDSLMENSHDYHKSHKYRHFCSHCMLQIGTSNFLMMI
jgi:hypothetical protein